MCPAELSANWLSGSEVLTVNTLESTTSSRSFWPALHFLEQSGIGQIGCNAGVGEAPHIGNSLGGALIDREPDPGLEVEADGKEQLQPRRLVALAFDQVDADGGLTRLECAR